MKSLKPSLFLRYGLALGLLLCQPLAGEDFSIRSHSPDQSIHTKFEIADGELTYEVTCDGQTLVQPSRISLLDGEGWSFVSNTSEKISTQWEPVWGQFSEIRDECLQQTLALKTGEISVQLQTRNYDGGVAFRLIVPPQAALASQKLQFRVDYQISEEALAYSPNGENDPFGPIALKEVFRSDRKHLDLPLVLDSPEGRWMALLDSNLYAAKLFSTTSFTWEKKAPILHSKASLRSSKDGFEAPWKVILLEKNLGDLLTNPLPLNVADPCFWESTDWVQPGLGLWDWRVHGYDNGEFKYGIDTRSYLRLIDFAAAQGIDYLTIDDHWFTVNEAGKLIPVPAVDMPRVMAYAAEKGVAIMLYYDRRKVGKNPLISDKELLQHYRELGAAGIKYGFMGNKAGVTRTLPNMLSREYYHAQQDSRRAYSPTAFLKMATINALTGPLDQANGNFGIRSINAGERMKGPRKKNSYVSTVVSEVARTLVISSGLITLPDAPEEYLKKADLFEFLKTMPATWDETRSLNCEMAQYITTARRTGDTWFVGSVNNESPRSLKIPCDFLQPGVTYEATFYEDAADSHGINNPEAYRITTRQVNSQSRLLIKMAMGGGHAIILTPTQS